MPGGNGSVEEAFSGTNARNWLLLVSVHPLSSCSKTPPSLMESKGWFLHSQNVHSSGVVLNSVVLCCCSRHWRLSASEASYWTVRCPLPAKNDNIPKLLHIMQQKVPYRQLRYSGIFCSVSVCSLRSVSRRFCGLTFKGQRSKVQYGPLTLEDELTTQSWIDGQQIPSVGGQYPIRNLKFLVLFV